LIRLFAEGVLTGKIRYNILWQQTNFYQDIVFILSVSTNKSGKTSLGALAHLQERPRPSGKDKRQICARQKNGDTLAQLEGVHVGPEFAQAIADWHYWCSRGYRF
jgi:hypothetical protein